MDEREQYRELIRDNLEIDIRSQDRHYDLDRVNEIVEIMLDAVCSTRPTIRINGEDKYRNRAFWCRGHCVDTAGKNKAGKQRTMGSF